jgi:hypothetical protein
VAVEYRAIGTVASGTGAITPALPAGRLTDDLLLLLVETANQAVTLTGGDASNWLQLSSSPQGTGTAAGTAAARLTVFYRWVTGTEAAPGVGDSGDHQIARIIAYSGVDTSAPFNVQAGTTRTTAGTTVTFPSVVTTADNCMILLMEAHSLPDSTSTAIVSGHTNANLTGITERLDNNTNAGNGGGISLAEGLKATAGTVGTSTATVTTSSVGGMITLALKPAPLATRTGDLAATETGSDTFASNGDVFVQGALAVSETGADTFAASGTVTDPAIVGTLAATETGSDTFAATGDVLVLASLAATESGSDTFSATGDVLVRGSLTVTEAGADVFAATGDVVVQGTLAATETGQDTFSGIGGAAGITGTFAASEAGNDTFAGTGGAFATGSLAATETGSDTLAASGDVFVAGVMLATESADVAGDYVEDGYVEDGYYLQAWAGTVSGTPPEPPTPANVQRGDGVDARWTKKQRKARDKQLEREREDREKLRQVIEQIIDPKAPEPVEVVATAKAVKVETKAEPILLPKLPTIDLAEVKREIMAAVANAQAARREQEERAAMQAEAERVAQENIRKRIQRKREDEILMLM